MARQRTEPAQPLITPLQLAQLQVQAGDLSLRVGCPAALPCTEAFPGHTAVAFGHVKWEGYVCLQGCTSASPPPVTFTLLSSDAST